jgi:hypothetical protein
MNMSECAKDRVETKGETGKSTAAINKITGARIGAKRRSTWEVNPLFVNLLGGQ